MVVVQNEDGTPSWQTSAQPSRAALDDEDLSWEAFCNACPRLVKAAAAAQWTDERVDILAGFFGGILSHTWRGSRDPLQQQTLQVYMAEQRRLWHVALANDAGYNLSIINDRILDTTYHRVYAQDRARLDALARSTNAYVQ